MKCLVLMLTFYATVQPNLKRRLNNLLTIANLFCISHGIWILVDSRIRNFPLAVIDTWKIDVSLMFLH